MRNVLINNATNIIENIIELEEGGQVKTLAEAEAAINALQEFQATLGIALNIEVKLPQNTYILPVGCRVEESDFGIVGKTMSESLAINAKLIADAQAKVEAEGNNNQE